MREWNKTATTLLLGLVLWTFCLFIYLSHLPLNYTYDGMVFASHVERSDLPLWDYFHPHHLIYTFLGRLFFLWGKVHGATWDGLVTLQFMDILTGVFGIWLTFHLLVRETNDRLIAFLSALGLSFTFSYWYFSTSPGVRIFATVTPLLTWYVLTFWKSMPPYYGWVVGLAHTLAVLGHQTNLLLVPAFLGGIWCLNQKTNWQKLRASFYYLTALSCGVLIAYGFIGRYICYRKTYSTWLWWVFSYFHVREWGGHLQSEGFERGKFAMVQAFLVKGLPSTPLAEPLTFGMAKTLFQYALWIILGLMVLGFKNYLIKHRQVFWVGIFWLLAFVPFFIWWEPWNIEFWVSSTVPCWILMGVIASDWSKKFKQPILRFANRGFVLLIWSGLMLLLFFYNFQGVLAKSSPSPNAHGQQALLGALDWKVQRDDLLILTGINTVPFYLDRYQKREYLSLHAYLKRYVDMEKNSEKDLENAKKENEKMVGSQVAPPDPWKDLSDSFQHVWKRHKKIWVLAEVVDNQDGWCNRLEQLMKLPNGQLSNYFHQYELTAVSFRGKVYFYQVMEPVYVPSPSNKLDDSTSNEKATSNP